MAWTTLSLQVTTPLFNGGADPGGPGPGAGAGFRPDDEAGVRPASIRGAMRFWFRALAGCVTGPDLGLLASLEQRVFGSAENASPVVLRITRQPTVTPPGARHSFLPDPGLSVQQRRQDDSRWILYLMGQGLADLSGCRVTRPYVAPGETFDLKISFRHQPGESGQVTTAIEGLAFASIWLLCAYGGIGARTRRGFGGLRITAADGPLPDPWQEPGTLLTPDLSHYERLRRLWPEGPLASCMRYIQALAPPERHFDPRGAWQDTAPTFPVLSATHAPAATSGGQAFLTWENTLIHAGEQFRHFRASRDNTRPGARYEPKIETPEWVHTVNGHDDRFAVGALGLPVVYRDDYVVNADRPGVPQPLRRASPLWLRAVGENDTWRLLSFAFQTAFMPGPDAPGVHLWHHASPIRELHVTNDDVTRLTSQWITVLRDDGSFIDQHRRS